MIKIKDFSFTYKTRKGEQAVFQNLDLELPSGFTVILGPNGAGKSTLLKAIFGLLKYAGVINYMGKEISSMPISQRSKFMSYLPQMDIDKSTLTVLEMVLLGRLPELGHRVKKEDLDTTLDTLKALNIEDLASRCFSELSGGQKKMVFIAQTLVRNPELILLDEPVNSLDLQRQLELCQFLKYIIKNKDISIIVVLHDINLAARFADNITVLDKKGKLYSSGTPKEVVTEEMIKNVYGVISSVYYDIEDLPTLSVIRSVNDNF